MVGELFVEVSEARSGPLAGAAAVVRVRGRGFALDIRPVSWEYIGLLDL